MDSSAALLTAGNITLALSVAAAYGLALLYAYQLGFLYSLGFQYAAMTSPLDVLTDAGLVLGYAVPIFVLLISLFMGVQGASQLGFDLARWMTDHELAINILIVAITTATIIVDILNRSQRKFLLIGLALNWISLFALLYAAMLADHKIRVWGLLFTATTPFLLSFGLGYHSAHYAMTADRRRYDIWLEHEQLSGVRLIRFSSFGIFYVQEQETFVAFASMSKLVNSSEHYELSTPTKNHPRRNALFRCSRAADLLLGS